MSSPTADRAVDEGIETELRDLLDRAGASANRDVLLDILRTAFLLAGDGADRLDLKITSAALQEMREAFLAFAPYTNVPKITIFGSARTLPADPLYAQAKDLASKIATMGWMVVTGAGPGIMAAGLEGAGRENAFGVTIRLPFEESVSEFIAGDEKLVSMKYFFTRKLMLMKESSGFVALPGGFGTLDETLELLTLQQTGKAIPAPIVLLDVPSGNYWEAWERFVDDEVARGGLISPEDRDLYVITDDVSVAVNEIVGFYRNYHSIRWVGDRLVVRLLAPPTDEEVEGLNERFGDLCVRGRIRRSEPLPPEVSGRDHLDLPRLVLQLNVFKLGRFRMLLDALNGLASAPPLDANVPTPADRNESAD
jgi:uncharacterized protein (TIGR00730 family)